MSGTEYGADGFMQTTSGIPGVLPEDEWLTDDEGGLA